jgi:hypothetical protein
MGVIEWRDKQTFVNERVSRLNRKVMYQLSVRGEARLVY